MIVRLRDQPASFQFQEGALVARSGEDGSPSQEDRGVVVDAERDGPGPYHELYTVRRKDGFCFRAKDVELVLIP